MRPWAASALRWTLTPLQGGLDAAAREFLQPGAAPSVDFARPLGEPALTEPTSVSWRIFKNPVSLFIGGMTAVMLELAEPRVRTGVWEHSSFRRDPVGRLQRTGLAAMTTVYGPRSTAEAMIAGVARRHRAVRGRTPDGAPYGADDPALLRWVQATAVFGFAEAYNRYVAPLGPAALDLAFQEAAPAAALYGASEAPRSKAAYDGLLAETLDRLEPSPIVFHFLTLMRRAALPLSMRPLQGALVRAAVDLVPPLVRVRLGLTDALGLRAWESPLVRAAATAAENLMLPSSPPVLSCVRLGLPADFLYRR